MKLKGMKKETRILEHLVVFPGALEPMRRGKEGRRVEDNSYVNTCNRGNHGTMWTCQGVGPANLRLGTPPAHGCTWGTLFRTVSTAHTILRICYTMAAVLVCITLHSLTGVLTDQYW